MTGILKHALSRWAKEVSPELREVIRRAKEQRRILYEEGLQGQRDVLPSFEGRHGMPRAERVWEDELFSGNNARANFRLSKEVPASPVLGPSETQKLWELGYRQKVPGIPSMDASELFNTMGTGGPTYYRRFEPAAARPQTPSPAAVRPQTPPVKIPQQVQESLLKKLRWPLGIAGAIVALSGLGLGAAHLFGGRKSERHSEVVDS